MTGRALQETVILCIIKGIKVVPHILLALSIMGLFGLIFVLIRWYRADDLDPKFRMLIGFGAAVVVLACVTGNMYVFNGAFKKSKCKYYSMVNDTDKCLEGICSAAECMFFRADHTIGCVYCNQSLNPHLDPPKPDGRFELPDADNVAEVERLHRQAEANAAEE